ncbi:MAG TPA: hypothetical protein VJB65_04820 [Patescibacteria group bacterium]|nr:hypothetical protein [Patescibacteria group bacterium]
MFIRENSPEIKSNQLEEWKLKFNIQRALFLSTVRQNEKKVTLKFSNLLK